MPIPFFKALNPVSKNSAVNYILSDLDPPLDMAPCKGKEMIDLLVTERIYQAFHHDYYLETALFSTYEIIAGRHYDFGLKGRFTAQGGSKGLLDFLILPLIARKTFYNFRLFCEEDPENINLYDFASLFCGSILAIMIEIARSFLAVALTIAVIPLMVVIHLLKLWILSEKTKQHLKFFDPKSPKIEKAPAVNHNKIFDLNLDIPEEFVCPLSGCIMDDPLMIPGEPGLNFERSWIFSSEIQYFNLEDMKENVELREQINRYVAEELEKAAAQAAEPIDPHPEVLGAPRF